jgi:hypothetical protein
MTSWFERRGTYEFGRLLDLYCEQTLINVFVAFEACWGRDTVVLETAWKPWGGA